MTAKYEKATGEYEAVKKKIEIVKSQITKYEQLIDSLNEQIILYKRDVKENEINYNQTCKNIMLLIMYICKKCTRKWP